jgi:predicted Na+-dependent transporter
MGLVFVLGTIASMGLSLTIAQITGPLRNGRFVIMALLTNFVIPPILAFILIQIFSLDESLAVGLLLVSLAAGTLPICNGCNEDSQTASVHTSTTSTRT